MSDFAILSLFIGSIVALLFRPTWWLLGRVFGIAFFAAKWLIIVGAVFGLMNTSFAYRTFGWTPVSLMLGDRVYHKSTQQ